MIGLFALATQRRQNLNLNRLNWGGHCHSIVSCGRVQKNVREINRGRQIISEFRAKDYDLLVAWQSLESDSPTVPMNQALER